MVLVVSAKHNSPAGAVRNQKKWKYSEGYCDLYHGMPHPSASVHKDYRREKVLLQSPCVLPPCSTFSKQKLQLKLCQWPSLMQCLRTSSHFVIFEKEIFLSSLEMFTIKVGWQEVPTTWEETIFYHCPATPVFRAFASPSENKMSPVQLQVPTCHGMTQREIKCPAHFLLFSLPPSGKFHQTHGFKKIWQIHDGSW